MGLVSLVSGTSTYGLPSAGGHPVVLGCKIGHRRMLGYPHDITISSHRNGNFKVSMGSLSPVSGLNVESTPLGCGEVDGGGPAAAQGLTMASHG